MPISSKVSYSNTNNMMMIVLYGNLLNFLRMWVMLKRNRIIEELMAVPLETNKNFLWIHYL